MDRRIPTRRKIYFTEFSPPEHPVLSCRSFFIIIVFFFSDSFARRRALWQHGLGKVPRRKKLDLTVIVFFRQTIGNWAFYSALIHSFRHAQQGTGLGHYLNVHEGPHGIGTRIGM